MGSVSQRKSYAARQEVPDFGETPDLVHFVEQNQSPDRPAPRHALHGPERHRIVNPGAALEAQFDGGDLRVIGIDQR